MDDKLHCTKDYNNIGFLTGISAKDQAFNFVQNLGFDFAQNTGNLSSREDNINNISEDFSYDISQTRLALSQIGSTAYQTSYDNTGNITSKTGTGTGTYCYNYFFSVETSQTSFTEVIIHQILTYYGNKIFFNCCSYAVLLRKLRKRVA